MFRRVFHIVFASWLSLLLLFGLTPKDALHLLIGHHDTVHTIHDHSDELVLEPEHHHCEFLNFWLLPFVQDSQFPFIRPVYLIHETRNQAAYTGVLLLRSISEPALRGPPAVPAC